MRKPLGSAVFLVLLLWSRGETSSVGGHSTCVTSGTVFDGGTATVTCHFHRPHEKFMVYRLRASSEEEKEIVVVCTHTESGPECTNPDGHKVTASVAKDQATVHITSARQKNSGTYFCKTLPARDDHASNCTLTVQSNTLRTGSLVQCEANAPVSLGQKSWLACTFSRNAGSTGISLVKQQDWESVEEEILTCKGSGQCESKKDGYVIEKKSETYVRVSIPQFRTDHVGHYKCKSATLKGITSGCQLKANPVYGDADDGMSPWTIAALVALAVVAIVLGVVLLIVYKRRTRYDPVSRHQ